jgi:hypothetical protein
LSARTRVRRTLGGTGQRQSSANGRLKRALSLFEVSRLTAGILLVLTPDLEGHRKRLREALGNPLSDEFVDVILGKLVEALRPGLYDQLDEATLNAALAMQPRSELQALLAVQIIATGDERG